jgi:hypothetical protein
MLSQIPSVSVSVAKSLLNSGKKTLFEFVDECKSNPYFLSEIEIEQSGKTKKLNRTVIESIEKYLLRINDTIITINDTDIILNNDITL